jgi:undecaprenyl-diphosphatase
VLDALEVLDLRLMQWVSALPHPAWLTAVALALSAIGRAGAVWWMTGLLFAIAQPRTVRAWLRLGLAILATYLLVDFVIKPLIARPRPFLVDPALAVLETRAASYAFPSGHAASAAAGAAGLSLIAPAWRALWWALALAIAGSRIYLGQHYPLDVVGGLALGLGVAVFVTALVPAQSNPRLTSHV